MTEEPRPGVKPITDRPPAHDGGNAAVKWGVGVAVIAALLFGGYAIVKNLPSTQPAAEVASMEPALAPAPAYPAGPSAAPPETSAQNGVTTEVAPDAAVPTTTKAATKSSPARARTKTASAAPAVPEEVIGVGVEPANVSGGSDEIIVTPSRRPVWARTPNAHRLSALYPARALERGREGEASIHCTVQDGGALDCVRVSESPVNAGFGNAALRVARTLRHAPQRWDGSPAAGTPVNLRVVFRMPDEDRRRT